MTADRGPRRRGDQLRAWVSRRKANSKGSRPDVSGPGVGAGFTLLRLTGHIDEEGRALVQRAVERLEGIYGEQPQLTTMRVDLESWANRTTR
jgi:hypothetical protein